MSMFLLTVLTIVGLVLVITGTVGAGPEFSAASVALYYTLTMLLLLAVRAALRYVERL